MTDDPPRKRPRRGSIQAVLAEHPDTPPNSVEPEVLAQRRPFAGELVPPSPRAKNRQVLGQLARDHALITRALGRRLRHWVRQTSDGGEQRTTDALAGGGPLPPEEWTANYREYSRGVLGLLQEERTRMKMAGRSLAKSVPELTESELAQEMRLLAEESVARMSDAELELELARRRAPGGPPVADIPGNIEEM